MSLGYTLLLNRTITCCEAMGLEVALGALHEYRPGRPSLACDLMEPLRVPAVDRWVVALCNQARCAPEDFVPAEGGVRLKKDVFPEVLADWEKSWYKMQHDAYLISSIEAYVGQIRRLATSLPIPSQGGQNGEGSGNDASGEMV